MEGNTNVDYKNLKSGEVVHFNTTDLNFVYTERLTNKQGKYRTYCIFTCPLCSKDSELWPEGSIRCLSYEIKSGRSPCGCKKSIKYTERQNFIRVKRKCETLNYEFLGWTAPLYHYTQDRYKNI